jgi:hypothetical protein
MSDTSINKIIQYGTNAERLAFTPDPAAGSQVLYQWYETDNAPDFYGWNGSAWVKINVGAAPVTCALYHTADQSIPDATWTTVSFNSEFHDTLGLHDNSTNNSRITIVSGAGARKYTPHAQICFDADTTGGRGLRFLVNGTDAYYGNNLSPAGGGVYTIFTASVPPISLGVGDYIELQAYQNRGSALNVIGSGTLPYATTFGIRG